jgi:hypothetical protein
MISSTGCFFPEALKHAAANKINICEKCDSKNHLTDTFNTGKVENIINRQAMC